MLQMGGRMKSLEDHVIDQHITYPRSYTLTEEEILSVVKQWDPRPFHIDKEAAEKSFFKGLIACSTYLFGISSMLPFPDMEEWVIIGSLGSNNVKNNAPDRPGDILKLSVTCISKRKSEPKPGLGIVEYYVELNNQYDEVVFSYKNPGLHKLRPI